MKYYINTNKELFGIEQGQEFLVKADWVEMTVGEIELFKNPPKTAEQLQQELNAEALAYLASTDWYVIRLQETGIAVPQDVLDARAKARGDII